MFNPSTTNRSAQLKDLLSENETTVSVTIVQLGASMLFVACQEVIVSISTAGQLIEKLKEVGKKAQKDKIKAVLDMACPGESDSLRRERRGSVDNVDMDRQSDTRTVRQSVFC